MPSFRAAGAALCAVASVVALSGTVAHAAPAPALPAAGKPLLDNGTFAKPGPAKNEGVAPKNWTLVDLGAETKPYKATIGVYNARGIYPPPAGNPNKSDIADDVFYESGTATGVEGIGGEQTSAQFGSITQANNPTVSYANAQYAAPGTSVSAWAGSGLEINFNDNSKPYTLIFLNPWTPPAGTYASAPADTATTKYIVGPALSATKAWNTMAPVSLTASVKSVFHFSRYTLTSVAFIDLEDATNAGSPYPNMNGYVADVAIDEGPASS